MLFNSNTITKVVTTFIIKLFSFIRQVYVFIIICILLFENVFVNESLYIIPSNFILFALQTYYSF